MTVSLLYLPSKCSPGIMRLKKSDSLWLRLSRKLPIDGALKEFLSHIYNFDFWFSIIEPECKGLNFEYQQRYRIIRAQYYVKTGFFIYSLYLQIKLYVPDIG